MFGTLSRLPLGRVLAGLIIVGSSALVAPPAQASASVSITVTPGKWVLGDQARATGKVRTKQKRTVQLQVRTAAGWTVAATARTYSRGRYAVSDKVSRTGTYRVVLPRQKVRGRVLGGLTSSPRTVVTSDTLPAGRTLAPGQRLLSADGVFQLAMRPDGNLALTRSSDPATVLWSSQSTGRPGARAVMQNRGDLVVVAPDGTVLWQSGTSAPGTSLVLRADAHLLLMLRSTTYWDTGTLVTATPPAVPTGADTAAVRAQSWVDAKVKYSQARYYKNQYGSYRTDCSGFVSMAWALPGSYTTRTLPNISHAITKADLTAGDLILATGRHVVMFDGWADSTQTSYWGYEESSGPGAVHRVIPFPYFKSYYPGSFKPVRRN